MLLETSIHTEGPSSLILECSKVRSNIVTLKKLLPENGRLMAIIKAYGYGQDDIRLTKFLENLGIDIFGVAYVEEGMRLRNFGYKGDIFIIHASETHAKTIIEHDLQVAVSTLDLIEELQKEAKSAQKIAKVHLHIDTGMTRFGIKSDKALIFGKKIKTCSSLKFEGLLTHLAASDDPEQDPFTHAQIKTLESALSVLEKENITPTWVHAANSAGLLRHTSKKLNMARVGLSLFGVPNGNLLSPAVSLVSKLTHIHECEKGETVSYNRNYRVTADKERIGVIACGYHDGIPRSVSGKGYALIRGKKAPYVGTVCMDYMMVSLKDIPEAECGDDVLIFGEHIPIELFSDWAGTIPHEILCRIASRVCRIYKGDENEI